MNSDDTTYEIFTMQETSLERMDLPPILYKYRDWKIPNHQKILTNRQVWLSRPSLFEDQLDCKNPIRYDLLTREKIHSIYLNDSKERHPERTQQQHEEFAREWTKNSPLLDKKHLEWVNEEHFAKLDARFGVLSLTKNQKSVPMWESYGDNHTGFCIGYNSKIAFESFGGGGEVIYVEELPIIKPYPFNDYLTQSILRILFKLKKWEYEEEYRVHKLHKTPATDAERAVALPPQAYAEIIFGAKITPEHKQEITDIANNTLGHIKLWQAHLTDDGQIEIIQA